ncbi:hypothetical protein [Spirosoma sordidisoli]|uniref:Uncharacterized protein n=1 Tax=Spirosoma sordidisoli TaxID=2502893 RepID=A0A4Q2UN14_9BACT|nr:hypothetical protein [Spirosoma sordidisoli]RYC70706.1 hypothetical protein EQG79_00710 [Spirosoma sordidisoli]
MKTHRITIELEENSTDYIEYTTCGHSTAVVIEYSVEQASDDNTDVTEFVKNAVLLDGFETVLIADGANIWG